MDGSDYVRMHDVLMRSLRLMHEPVGMTFIFDDERLGDIQRRGGYCEPVRPLTFCQAELGARMEGRTVLLEMKKLWCLDARCSFGVDEVSETVVNDLLRFGTDREQVRAFVESVQKGENPPIDVYDTASWMCITALSEQSIAMGGMPVPFPDFTNGKWIDRGTFKPSKWSLDEVYDM